ncbi:MAG: response regulator [Desulfobulbus sp.]|nr:response regulator [Desulfobulbus sp.]
MPDRPSSILVVDDSPVNQQILRNLLTKAGYDVRLANSGKEVLTQIFTNQPDLLLLDIVMPGMDGFELCRLLKEHPETSEIPVIFISSLDNTSDKVSGFAAGGVDYITKPFQHSEVLARISTHLKICRLQQQLTEQNHQLELEKERSEALLLNVLPARVAAELMEKGSCTPQHYDEVTVCFVDLVGFTAAATVLPPETLISELNELFTAFDRITEANHCERIKTIGDAYLYVAGLPEPDRHHVQHAAIAALEMLAYLTRRNETAAHRWEVRIGIHTGPVIGGIVGTRKYLFDIFGDTVNTAARLQTLSRPMCINASQAVRNRLQHNFCFSNPSAVNMKGKGVQLTCFLESQNTVEPD